MCGIIGAVSGRLVTSLLIEGLKKLEYRGYDSAGIALLGVENQLQCKRVVGKVRALETAMVDTQPVEAYLGIAHTRWATHGIPSEQNAHPFVSGQFALVHNGIIENHASLRAKLLKSGYCFSSETDTEVAAHLIHYYFTRTDANNWIDAVCTAVSELKGDYAFGIVFAEDPHRLIGVRQGAPLIIGVNPTEHFIASDPLALATVTEQFIDLKEGDLAILSQHQVDIYDSARRRVKRKAFTLLMQSDLNQDHPYQHNMQKEIMEQPMAMTQCLKIHLRADQILPEFHDQFQQLFQKKRKVVNHIQLVACGTSYHAALIARYWIEWYAHIPCSVEMASEFRYRAFLPSKNGLLIALSQSGETADTLAALRLAKQKGGYIALLVMSNTASSSMIREADMQLLTYAGTEIGVASTKTFTTQLIVLCLLAVYFHEQKKLSLLDTKKLIKQLQDLPNLVKGILKQDALIQEWAQCLMRKEHILFLGRGCFYPIALEGALKMKELSYICAEGYPAGELKHGPLALVEKNMPIVALAMSGSLLEKTYSNLQEVRARGGDLYVLTDCADTQQQIGLSSMQSLFLPAMHTLLAPILSVIPLQLLAYYVAVFKGKDVDQPRNLAKSVTVE